MKKIICLILIIFLIPIPVSANTFVADFPNRPMEIVEDVVWILTGIACIHLVSKGFKQQKKDDKNKKKKEANAKKKQKELEKQEKIKEGILNDVKKMISNQ